MKKILQILVLILFISTGCEKELPRNTTLPPPQLPPPHVPVNTPPQASAGADIQLILPADSCMLVGIGWDADLNIATYQWKKISGPSAYTIETPDSVIATARHLQKGTYEFEFTVTDKGNLNGKDTVVVSVIDPLAPSREKIFTGLQFSCPMGCSLEIQNFYSFIPYGSTFTVYIKRQGSNVWIEVSHENNWAAADKYIYGIYNDYLWIYSDDEDYKNLFDVKIIY